MFKKNILRKLMLAFLAFILFCIGLHKFVASNLNYYYFEFSNATEREIEVSVEYYYIKDGSFSITIPPISEKKFRVSIFSESVNIKVNDLENEANFDYYLTSGDSFFFKTKFRLEYDGKNINVIYAEKVDYWF